MRALGPGARLAEGIEVIAHLARSNVLDVYDAWCARRGCRVAVKALRPDRLRDAGARRALLREGRLLRRLAHPHLVRAYELRDDERPVVVLETLRGATLGAMLAQSRLSPAETAQLGLQLGSALRYLHGERLVHLDVKPSNVIAHAGVAKLIDLSIAHRPGPVKPGLGTWCYLAPEQARGEHSGAAADVWGLGATLHEALTGHPAFDEDDDAEFPCLERRAEPIRRHRPRAPRALAEALDAALAPAPGDQPTLDALLDALDACAGHPAGRGRWT